jgi:hypothetical protein
MKRRSKGINHEEPRTSLQPPESSSSDEPVDMLDPEQLAACRAYATMVNRLDYKELEPWLHDDLIYESQWVFEEMRGKKRYARYIRGKLKTIRKMGIKTWAEIALTNAFGTGYCVILGQGSEEGWKATLLVQMLDGKIKRMDMCCVPSPHECRRTGEQPR